MKSFFSITSCSMRFYIISFLIFPSGFRKNSLRLTYKFWHKGLPLCPSINSGDVTLETFWLPPSESKHKKSINFFPPSIFVVHLLITRKPSTKQVRVLQGNTYQGRPLECRPKTVTALPRTVSRDSSRVSAIPSLSSSYGETSPIRTYRAQRNSNLVELSARKVLKNWKVRRWRNAVTTFCESFACNRRLRELSKNQYNILAHAVSGILIVVKLLGRRRILSIFVGSGVSTFCILLWPLDLGWRFTEGSNFIVFAWLVIVARNPDLYAL